MKALEAVVVDYLSPDRRPSFPLRDLIVGLHVWVAASASPGMKFFFTFQVRFANLRVSPFTRCDTKRPSCEQCVKAKMPCVYDDRPAIRPTDLVRSFLLCYPIPIEA